MHLPADHHMSGMRSIDATPMTEHMQHGKHKFHEAIPCAFLSDQQRVSVSACVLDVASALDNTKLDVVTVKLK